MIERLLGLLRDHREPTYLFLRDVRADGARILDASDVRRAWRELEDTEEGKVLTEAGMGLLVDRIQEAVVQDSLVFLAIREDVARWRYVEVHAEEMRAMELDVSRYLAAKERAVFGGGDDRERWALELDLSPFEREFPKIQEAESIGRGVEFLNRHLSDRLFGPEGPGCDRLMDFLRVHQVQAE